MGRGPLANPHLNTCPHCGRDLEVTLEDINALDVPGDLVVCPGCGAPEDSVPFCRTCAGCPDCCECPGAFFRPGAPDHG